MKLAYFPNHCALNSQAPMSAFLASCRDNGIELVENSMDADAAVIWSVTWAGRLAGNQLIYQHYRQTGRPVIILEVGSLHRGQTWKVAVNHITADGYYGHQHNLDWDRPTKLKLVVPQKFIPKTSVLIVAQNSQSLQTHRLQSTNQWIADTVQQIQTHTTRPIVVRPHPRSRIDLSLLPANVHLEVPRKLTGTYDSYNIDYQHHAVINYNSGAGIQAALAGAAVIVDQSSLAHPVGQAWSCIENQHRIDQTEWIVQIAHTEYLVQEIERGLWIPRLTPMLPL
jgi:hypothetical protein